jgi:hypothetical protein
MHQAVWILTQYAAQSAPCLQVVLYPATPIKRKYVNVNAGFSQRVNLFLDKDAKGWSILRGVHIGDDEHPHKYLQPK